VARAIRSYREAIERFPSTTKLADAIGKPGSTCRSWHARDSIPPEYFAYVAAAAAELRVAVTEADLWHIFNARARDRINSDEGDA